MDEAIRAVVQVTDHAWRCRTLLAVVAASALAADAVHAQGASPRPPNILLIVADDLGYGDLGSYGHHTIQTPNLDRLAREGLRFTSYYAASPLCSPSRAAMLTGRTPFRTGIESWIPEDADVQLSARETTIATLLKGRGYATFLAGKWHLNGGLDVARHTQPQDHGFDHWLAFHAFAIPSHRDPENFFRDGKPLGRIHGYAAQIVVDEAIGYLEHRPRGAPFFLYVALAEPHGTIASPERFTRLYASLTRGRPEPFANGGGVPSNLAARGPGEYYASVTHLDFQVGRLLEYVDRPGIRDETLVVFTSDNGPVTDDWRHWYEVNLYGSTSGLRGRKADLYEGGIRVPAIVRWPGHVVPGGETDAPVIGYDLLPTLAAVAGAAVPADRPLDGEDFSPLLRGAPLVRQRPLFWEFEDDQGFHYALRDRDWKLIADRALAKVRLFDLARDRFEVDDRAAREPERVEALRARVRTMAADVARDPLRPVHDDTRRRASMPSHAAGTFDVTLAPAPADEKAGDATLGRMAIDKQFHGDLEGTSRGQMLTAGTAVKGSAGYVAIEKVSGTLAGRRGTFVLQHSGTMNRGGPSLVITVVPDSGTGQLAGLSGTMTITIAPDGRHSYALDYTFTEQP